MTVDKQVIVNIHNAIAGMHYTGEDIVTAAALMMDLRKLLQEEEPEQEENDG